MPSDFEIFQELRPVRFSFSHENYVCMKLGFIWHQCDMRAPQCHCNSSLAKLRSEIVRVGRAWCMKSDSNKIRSDGRVNRQHLFINMNYFPIG